jgi:transposase-like protein
MKATRYDAAFKKEAIAMVNELGLAVTAVSEKLGAGNGRSIKGDAKRLLCMG